MTLAMACSMYEMVVYYGYLRQLVSAPILQGSEGAHPPLLLQRCAAVPHDSQRQKWHGCKQGAGSGRPNLYLLSQSGAAFLCLGSNSAVSIGPPLRRYGAEAESQLRNYTADRREGGKMINLSTNLCSG